VSGLPYITSLLWSPIVISVAWSQSPTNSGSLVGPNLSFEFLVAMIVVNLGLEYKNSQKYFVVDTTLLLAYVAANSYEWTYVMSYVLPLQSAVQWNPLFVLIGWGATIGGRLVDGLMILPNFTLLIALALGMLNIAYTRMQRQHVPRTASVAEKM
jgi:hypothetical protein